MPEQPFPEPPWRGRPLQFSIEVRDEAPSAVAALPSDEPPARQPLIKRATVAWADNGEALAVCEAAAAADAVAGAAAALTGILGRIEVAEGFRRGVESLQPPAESPPD